MLTAPTSWLEAPQLSQSLGTQEHSMEQRRIFGSLGCEAGTGVHVMTQRMCRLCREVGQEWHPSPSRRRF